MIMQMGYFLTGKLEKCNSNYYLNFNQIALYLSVNQNNIS